MYYYSKIQQNQQKQIQKAAAIGYNKDEDVAPRILAKGKGEVAKYIIELAEKENIPIRTEPELAEILMLLEINHYIPFEIYGVMAQIMTTLIKEDKKSE